MIKISKICKVEGCTNTTEKGAFGYCGMHYMRFKRYGDINYITPSKVRSLNLRNSQPKTGNCQDHTYKKYLGRHAHRRIMEEKLGRKLNSNEIVHHIDGNKHNNDPENLTLVSRQEHARLHFSNVDHSYHCKNILCIFPDGSEKIFNSGVDASRATNVAPANISSVCKGKYKQCSGYKFKFV